MMVLPEQPMRDLLWDIIAEFEQRITALEAKIAEPHDRLEALEQRIANLERHDVVGKLIDAAR